MAYYYLAAIDAKAKRWEKVYAHVEKALIKKRPQCESEGLKGVCCSGKLGRKEKAAAWLEETWPWIPLISFPGMNG